ncbi:predicted protein [Naegleria gruberi]|uniref:Predicted protein n=1 Tax=Naegleria gruberi TaxID=5762 RepID=D2V0M4_NAEGR|nr:uncharacterized protein NAEGRDRAFT_62345 [Naegleria gruberi]EFC49749.1 predicted protein [Naegleria gruberi]|eukprot:XP_002682493.1 predicted protein [Naegleria gruberi strain NEG-M]
MSSRFLTKLFLGVGGVLFTTHIAAGSPKTDMTGVVSDSPMYKTLKNSCKDIQCQVEELKKQGKSLDNQDETIETICSKQLDSGVCKALMVGNFEKFKSGTFSNTDLMEYVAHQIAKERKENPHGHHGHH